MYNKGIIDSLEQISELPEQVNYALCGVKGETMNLHHIIADHFPKWNLCTVIDDNYTVNIKGIRLESLKISLI
ncbi:hypothetical protein JCM10914A_15190 [Paenibacillus sp. JCM 10914]|nr:hypothetical protein JCM10914_5456 [Paenibacillus sp. JCM 10914]